MNAWTEKEGRNMDMNSEEPLNLTIKKRPVAIVPPSSINLDANKKTINNNINNIFNNNNNNNNTNNNNNNVKTFDYSDEQPQDLSMHKNNKNTEDNKMNNEKLTYEQQMKYYLDNNNQEFCKYLHKNVEDEKNNYNKNYFADNLLKGTLDLKANLFKDVYKMSDFYDNLTSKNLTSSTENFYTMLNHLTEQKFLATLYMNSVLSMNMPYLNLQEMASYDRNTSNSSPNKNSILNNLLSKKSHNEFSKTSPPNFDTLIKNEMCNDIGDLKNSDIKMNRYFFFFIMTFILFVLIKTMFLFQIPGGPKK